MIASILYFHGSDQLSRIHAMPNAQFFALGGIKSRANRYDSFNRLVGIASDGTLRPVERAIQFKRFPSRHVCSSKCVNGKPYGVCECSCGGKNHGTRGFPCAIV